LAVFIVGMDIVMHGNDVSLSRGNGVFRLSLSKHGGASDRCAFALSETIGIA